MKTTYIIPRKPSNSGSINDIASDMFDREIVFGKDCKYAVVSASYYGGKGYTTHRTEESAVAGSKRNECSHAIIDTQGNYYADNAWNGTLTRI